MPRGLSAAQGRTEPDEVAALLLACAWDLLRLAGEADDEDVRERRLDIAEDCIERAEARMLACSWRPALLFATAR
jgi:hypothetical protein